MSRSSVSSGRRPTLRHRIEYLAYRLVVGVVRIVPERGALLFGEGMGWLMGVVLRMRWKVVVDHLREAFPDRESGWHRRIARASFRHLGREAAATFRLGRMGAAEIRERTEMVGFGAFEDAVKRGGRGAMVYTGHLGNWEMSGACLAARGIPMDVVAQRQRNPLMNAEVNANRACLGMKVILRSEGPRPLLRSLRRGRVVGIVGDQNVRRGGVFVDFFGRMASTAKGAAVIALRTGVPVFVGAAIRMPGFPQRYRVTMVPVEFTPSGDLEADTLRLTGILARDLEVRASEHPEQYFWQHRRWKTRPPGEEA